MNRSRLSLMTFNLEKDIKRGTMTIRDTAQMAANAGIPFIDVMRTGEKSLTEYQNALKETDVKVYCYISCVSFFAKDVAIGTALERDMRVAEKLGAVLFMIVPYYPIIDNRKAKKMGRDKTLKQLIRGFRIAVEQGKKHDLKVCFETTPVEELHLSGTEDCRYVLDHVAELGLVFDTANMLPHGDETMEAYEALKDRIVHVHLKDVILTESKPSLFFPEERAADGRLMKGTRFGRGIIPIRDLYERMIKDGYTGIFAIEYMRPDRKPCTLKVHEAELEHYLERICDNTEETVS